MATAGVDIEKAVARAGVDVARSIARETCSRQPDCRSVDSGRSVEHSHLLERPGLISHHPAIFTLDVATDAAKAEVDDAILQQKSWTLLLVSVGKRINLAVNRG